MYNTHPAISALQNACSFGLARHSATGVPRGQQQTRNASAKDVETGAPDLVILAHAQACHAAQHCRAGRLAGGLAAWRAHWEAHARAVVRLRRAVAWCRRAGAERALGRWRSQAAYQAGCRAKADGAPLSDQRCDPRAHTWTQAAERSLAHLGSQAACRASCGAAGAGAHLT